MVNIAVFSYENDLHAQSVVKELSARPGVTAYLVSVDTYLTNGGVTWSSDSPHEGAIRSYQGTWFEPQDIDVVWWRRVNQPLAFPDWLNEPGEQDFTAQEWRGAIAGAFFDGFSGVWVNHPANDSRAANKLFQLTLAKEVGLRIPRTLISQQPSAIREFCRAMGGRIVAKKIVGSTLRSTISLVVDQDMLADDESVRICPAIYQEIIRSHRHVRANCFGSAVHATLIESEVFDWRRNLDVPFTPYDLDTTTRTRLVKLLDHAGLRMGIMDIILDEGDDPVWIELNPQGQFLFCEALSGYDLIGPFVDFLISQSKVTRECSTPEQSASHLCFNTGASSPSLTEVTGSGCSVRHQ